ncbi:MAG: hypothetical protein SOW12_00415 [Lachnospiraceae bacterium]|nr:hypothetical protein [Lachnospiraceae bacterium]
MSDSGNYNIFEGLAGFVKGLETFCNAIGKAITWYEENADIISSYLLVFAEFGEWSIATNKLIENQFVFTDNLTPDLAHEIYQGADVEEVMTRYYFDNDGQNMKKLIQRCKDSNYIREYRELYNQILNAYDREDYLLACIGLFSLVDGLLAEYSGMIEQTGFKKRLERISDKLADKVELNEIDKKTICIYEAVKKFDCSVFNGSDFLKEEPNTVNRHWDVHGRTHRKHTRIDFLKVLLWLDAVVYLHDKSTQSEGREEDDE